MRKDQPEFSLYPLLWLAVCFAGGILTANYLSFDRRYSLIACLIFGVLTAVFRSKKSAVFFLSLAFFFAGAFCLQNQTQAIAGNRLKKLYDENQFRSGAPIEIEGVLRGKPELAAGGHFLILKTEKAFYKNREVEVSGKVRIFVPLTGDQNAEDYRRLDLQGGSRLRIACQMRREDNFLNPGVIRHREILDQKDIDATCSVKSPLLIERLGESHEFTPLKWIYDWRQELIEDFKRYFSDSTAGVLIASLLGNKHFLDKQTAEVFREGGTFHVLVISGLHITFIGGLALLFVRFFTRKRLWQFVLAAAFLWAYSLAVGAEAPVVRASVMFTVLSFSQVVYRKGSLLNALGACALVLLVWRPQDLFNPSFQLTFASVAAIVAFAFPLIDNLRAIGSWSPSAEAPFPPNVPRWLKRFCETLYWCEKVWEIENKRQIWSARLFKSPYLKWLEAKGAQGIARYAFEGVLVSLVVQVWLLPLVVVYFHRVSPISVLLNLWVGIFIALESFAALAAVFFAQFSEIAALPLISLTEIINRLLLLVPQMFIESNRASMRVPVYDGAMKAIYLLYFAPILGLTFLLNKWNPFELGANARKKNSRAARNSTGGAVGLPSPRSIFFVILVFFVALILFHPFSAPRADGRLRVDFLDVGQGDAALVKFPNGETMLIDGGGRINFGKTKSGEDGESGVFEPDAPTIGEAVVSEFLWEKGYSKIDYILATHADADHMQGLTDVAKNFRVRAAFFGRMPENEKEFSALSEVLRKRGIESVKIARGDSFEIGGAQINVLFPERQNLPQAVSDNNNSVVLRIDFGAKSFLLTGDIEKETENLLTRFPESLKADIVKVAHHGSRTSSTETFVKASGASIAVISVGRESRFGHPHSEVVARWQNDGSRVLTTGERGTVSISTDGRDLRIETFLP